MSKLVKKVLKSTKKVGSVKSAPVCEPCKGKGLESSEKLCNSCKGSGVVHS